MTPLGWGSEATGTTRLQASPARRTDMPVEPKRVEAIRECIEAMDWFSIKAGDHWASVAGLIAEKAFPELASDPPTAWLAPWDMTDAMETAVDAHAESNGYETWPWPPNVWEAARDAHTKEQGGT